MSTDQTPARFLTVKAVGERYTVSVQTVWEWTRTHPDFPKPVKLSPGCTRWKLSDLVNWERSRETAA